MHSRSASATPLSPLPIYLRLPSVIRMTGLGRSTIYRMIANDEFPRQPLTMA
jgi:predicted DNA-binding transcriptional regulator AlpA